MTRNNVEDPRNRDDWNESRFEEKEICNQTYPKLIESHLDPNPSQGLLVLNFAREDSNYDIYDISFPNVVQLG
jgi:hypothetical protein